jgi:hypothetical protein
MYAWYCRQGLHLTRLFWPSSSWIGTSFSFITMKSSKMHSVRAPVSSAFLGATLHHVALLALVYWGQLSCTCRVRWWACVCMSDGCLCHSYESWKPVSPRKFVMSWIASKLRKRLRPCYFLCIPLLIDSRWVNDGITLSPTTLWVAQMPKRKISCFVVLFEHSFLYRHEYFQWSMWTWPKRLSIATEEAKRMAPLDTK